MGQSRKVESVVPISIMRKSKMITELHQNDLLRPAFKKLKSKLSADNFINCGTQVCCFNGSKRKTVLKLTPKKIGFFNNFKDFKSEINDMQPFFAPVLSIKFDNPDVFVYCQQKLKSIPENKIYVTMSILLMVIYMIRKNKIVTDIGTHNIGRDHANIMIYDYHGLHKINTKSEWWGRLAINLQRYIKPHIHLYPNNFSVSSLFKVKSRSRSDSDSESESDENTYLHNTAENLYLRLFKPLYDKYYNELSKKKKHIIDDKLSQII